MLAGDLKHFLARVFSSREKEPKAAYDLWAAGYDNQPGNLMLDLDEIIFSGLLSEISIEAKPVVDIGCGTGRHWPKLLAKDPSCLIGYDVSGGMLEKLKQKFPDAEARLLKGAKLVGLEDGSCTLVCSTLTIAHIRRLRPALEEWQRVLSVNGDMIITDYHPGTLQKGGRRTFTHEGKLIAVRNYIHPLDSIRQIARQLKLEEIRFVERRIDESVRPYYEQKNALPVYEQYKGLPVIYGIHFKRKE
jgi:ubiquinone/menaquinone biosynthesis C-methylase UbiE